MFTIEPPVRFISAERVLAAEERAVEIDRHGAAEHRVVGVLDGAELGDAGGIDEAVEPAGARLDARR